MRRASGRNRRRPRVQSCVLCCALTATGLLALVHLVALRAMQEPSVAAARDAAARTPKGGRLDESYHVVFSS